MPEESSPPSPPSDEPKAPEAPPVPKVRKVGSLTEIVEAAKKSPPKSDPIVIEWFLPPLAPTKENPFPQGEMLRLEVETRFSPDPWLFGIKYMSKVLEEKRSEDPDEKGVLVHKHPDADMVACAREIVVEPKWLHNEAAIAQLKTAIPPTAFSELRRKLMLAAGLDADFFADYQQLTVPRIYMPLDSALPNGSDSPRGRSSDSTLDGSSRGSTTTDSEPKKNGAVESPTISGSLP